MPRIAIQEHLFGGPSLNQVVNVSSVPKISPFRYPGGKTWLVPRIRTWLRRFKSPPTQFIEPFAGGAIIGLTVANESMAAHVILCEIDKCVGAVWQTVFGPEAKWLVDSILHFPMTLEEVRRVLATHPTNIREQAFQTILKNRTFHGGILAAGSSLLKHGENGRGIKSRWYPETLAKRILLLNSLQSRITFLQADGIPTISNLANEPDSAFFIDPPYTAGSKKAGNRLYTHFDIDHKHLFEVVAAIKGDFLMTYDHDEYVMQLAKIHGFDTELVSMKNTHHAEMQELLVGRDLDWARQR